MCQSRLSVVFGHSGPDWSVAHSIELLDVGHMLVDDEIVPVLWASSATTWSGGERHEPQYCVRARMCSGIPGGGVSINAGARRLTKIGDNKTSPLRGYCTV